MVHSSRLFLTGERAYNNESVDSEFSVLRPVETLHCIATTLATS